METIKTPIQGITTTATYQEGDCYSLVNLRVKNGALEPVAPRKVIQTLRGDKGEELTEPYNFVFVHQTNGYQNWIGVKIIDGKSSVYCNVNHEKKVPELIEENITGIVHSIQQIGNTLSLITGHTIFYLLYINGKYKFLGELPALPKISYFLHRQDYVLLTFKDEYGEGALNEKNIQEYTKGLVNKALEEFMAYDNVQLTDAHLLRYAFRLYDGNYIRHSPPLLLMPGEDIRSYKILGIELENSPYPDFVAVYGHRFGMVYDFEYLDKWKDIIESVDVFISLPLGLSSIENMRTDLAYKKNTTTNLIKEITSAMIQNIADTGSFYFLESFEIGSKMTSSNVDNRYPRPKSGLEKIENLIYRPTLPDDNFSNHTYGASCSYAYNNRLHLGGMQTTFFNGYDPKSFLLGGNYNGHWYPTGPNVKRWQEIVIETEIDTGTVKESVLNRIKRSSSNNSIDPLFMLPLITYPDSRAKRMTIYLSYDGTSYVRVKSFALKAHNYMNMAYYLEANLKPIIAEENISYNGTFDFEKKLTLFEPTKIKVSELNNPLIFPNTNNYQAGNGQILGFATNAIRISEGQFGQYPLYVFTTKGIYSLEVGGGEVVYSTLSSPTSYEIPTQSLFTSTPMGVVFITSRGVCCIAGQSVELLTAPVEQDNETLTIQYVPAMENVVHNFGDNSFNTYLQELSFMIYDARENELIFSNRKYPFNYVLNLYTQAFYQTTERFDLVVQNTFPNLYVIDGAILKDFAEINTGEDGKPERAEVSFITRPFTYGELSIKNLYGATLDGTLEDSENIRFTVHSSNDGSNFRIAKGVGPTNRSNRVLLRTGLIPYNKHRYTLYTFGGILSKESLIMGIDSDVKVDRLK